MNSSLWHRWIHVNFKAKPKNAPDSDAVLFFGEVREPMGGDVINCCVLNTGKKVLEVIVEKGMQNGQKISFPGEVDGAPYTVTGDILFVLQQKHHPKFKREGEAFFYEHTLSLSEALCGFKLVITHLDALPIYQRNFIRGKLYIHFTIESPDSPAQTRDDEKGNKRRHKRHIYDADDEPQGDPRVQCMRRNSSDEDDCILVHFLLQKLGSKCMVFINKSVTTELVASMLRNVGLRAIPLGGKMPQPKKLGALNMFKAGESNILVCTDVAGRGIDIPLVDVVVNYEIPTNPMASLLAVGNSHVAHAIIIDKRF
ncbi:hypothetical protein Droror1_Dr00004237 [Drosera rotundifolia]